MLLIKGVIATVFMIIYCQVRETLSSVTQCQETTFSIQNHVLAGYAFGTKPSANIEDCVMLCVEHPNCDSINYYRKTKICELNNKSAVSNPENMVHFELAMYMTNSIRIFSCKYFDFECGRQEDICQLEEGRNKCKACSEALGLQDGRIPDSAINVSSFYRDGLHPSRIRLNSPTSWTAAAPDGSPWLQVDLGHDVAIKKIATQGRHDFDQWVTSYKVSSRVDGGSWVMYQENNAVKVFQGNTDRDTVVSHVFPQHIRARFVRIWPQTWTFYSSMRAELYGCSFQ